MFLLLIFFLKNAVVFLKDRYILGLQIVRENTPTSYSSLLPCKSLGRDRGDYLSQGTQSEGDGTPSLQAKSRWCFFFERLESNSKFWRTPSSSSSSSSSSSRSSSSRRSSSSSSSSICFFCFNGGNKAATAVFFHTPASLTTGRIEMMLSLKRISYSFWCHFQVPCETFGP